MTRPVRRVGARLVVSVDEPVLMTLPVAVASPASLHVEETLHIRCGDVPSCRRDHAPGIGRAHVRQLESGRIAISDAVVVTGEPAPAAPILLQQTGQVGFHPR